MIVSLSMVKNHGIPVNLPMASTTAAQDQQMENTITVAKDGTLYFNKEPLRPNELPERLQQLKNMHPDPKVYISGDAQAVFGAAVGVLDAVRQAGITKVAIETKPSP
jgi:biopolymer transport protein ExbD